MFDLNNLVEIKLAAKYLCLNQKFIWSKIPSKFSTLIGINGVGKTSLLKLIDNALNDDIKKLKLFKV